jgi:hypothetical protein
MVSHANISLLHFVLMFTASAIILCGKVAIHWGIRHERKGCVGVRNCA